MTTPLPSSANSVTLRWTDGPRNGLDIGFYTLEAITSHTTFWFTLASGIPPSRTIGPNHREVDVTGRLQPWNVYRFRLRAGNYLGISEPSPPSSYYDVPAAPPTRAHFNIKGGGGREGALSIVWDPLPPQEQNGPNIGYNILFRKSGSDAEYRKDKRMGNTGRVAIQIGDDQIYQPYEVRIAAFNAVGDGPLSDAVIVHSFEKGISRKLGWSELLRQPYRNF